MSRIPALHWTRIFVSSCLASVLALLSYLGYFGLEMEEGLGLKTLFRLRGERKAPLDVAVITLDRYSARRLGVSEKLHQWPRWILSEVVDQLTREQVSFIAFDLFLKEIRDEADDKRLSESIARSGRVILFAQLYSETVGSAVIESIDLPHVLFARNARAIANFALPRLPHPVNEFWTFRPWMGDAPTVPAVALQLHLIDRYPQLIEVIREIDSSRAEKLPTADAVKGRGDLTEQVRAVRSALEGVSSPRTGDKELDALLSLYSGSELRFLNFYGPPRSIRTIPVADLIEGRAQLNDLKGRGVFVGLSDALASGQQEGFLTVYSRKDGLDISGVEIAATSYLNLLHRESITPLPMLAFIGLIVVFSLSIAISAELCGTLLSLVPAVISSLLYGLLAYILFSKFSLFTPIAVPLLVQTPVILLSLFALRHRSADREGRNIRGVLGYYLPRELAQKIDANRRVAPAILHEHHYGVCLFTDAASYTALAEEIAPCDLAGLLNRYYQHIFAPIRQRGGLISDVIGDAVMALWVSKSPDPMLARKACEAALDIGIELQRFAGKEGVSLMTRIGIHAGEVSMGSVGAEDHLEYRAVGDMVNTASRIQAVTKQLGCRVLISDGVYTMLESEQFIIRPLGRYRLVGKKSSLALYELIGATSEKGEWDRRRLIRFAEVLRTVEEHSLDKAIVVLAEFLKDFPDDGPGQFLTEKLMSLLEAKKDTAWDGVIGFDKK